MAFSRKAVGSIEGITPEQVDKIMALHGTSLSDYELKSEFDARVKDEVEKQVGEVKKQFDGIDIKALQEQAAQVETLQKELSSSKLHYALENRLVKEGAVNSKAVMALLDMSKVALKEDGTLDGVDDQFKSLKETEKWAFAQPSAGGQRQQVSAPTKTEDQAYLDSKYKNSPYYTAPQA